ncbi:hypothetical protein B0T10DRAFT_562520 [Thelonectria olida]|uniref:Uncharacterized protein n=1 Tax=Thelonectria olida TaxID=1576542 RepID=A0A9P8W1W1_9HYPO|nr:hypothetical protein B0T10DRAFT_562520 [Thelonectria olida]
MESGNSKQSKRSLSVVRKERSTRSRATLDSLPTEVLEKIFLYSLNLSLPRAAPLIGAKLSSRVTLLRLFIWAFHDTWDQYFGVAVRHGVLLGPDLPHDKDGAIPMIHDGDPVLQTAVLALPCVDIDFILQAQQTWADKYAKDRWYQHAIVGLDEGDAGFNPVRGLIHNFDGGFHHFNARQCFEADYQAALLWSTLQHWLGAQVWGFQDVHPLTRVPINLITGPWDDEKLRRLFWLARGGALNLGERGHAPAPPWEIRVELFRNSIIDVLEPVHLVCSFLHSQGFFEDLPGEVVRDELQRLTRRIEWGADSPHTRSQLREFERMLRNSTGHPTASYEFSQ